MAGRTVGRKEVRKGNVKKVGGRTFEKFNYEIFVGW